MKVFILEFQEYDDFYVIGVFSTLEKLEDARDEFLSKNEKYGIENTEITEHIVV